MWSAEDVTKRIKEFRDYLYHNQCTFEEFAENGVNIDQSIRVKQRISALLDIYSQILNGREFDENYLKRYL